VPGGTALGVIGAGSGLGAGLRGARVGVGPGSVSTAPAVVGGLGVTVREVLGLGVPERLGPALGAVVTAAAPPTPEAGNLSPVLP
jgi:hypothetical protein